MNDKERKSCIRTIEILRGLAFNVHGVMDVIDAQNCDKIIETLNKPERKNGKWIGYKDDDPQWKRDDGSPIFLICSECHETVLNNSSAHWNFCPNCGAKMEGV